MLVLSVAYLGFGGGSLWVQAAIHGLLILPLVVVVSFPGEVLSRVTGLGLVLLTGCLLLGSVGIGLIPIPATLGPWIQGAWEFERGEVGWASISLDPGRTLGSIFAISAVLAIGVASTVLVVVRRWRSVPETAVVVASLVAIGVAALHVVQGSPSLFGAVDVSSSLGNRPYFAPFLDVNHFGALLVLLFPLLLGNALDPGRQNSARLAQGVLAASMGGMALWAGSLGPLGVLAVQAAVMLLWWRVRGALIGVVLAGIGVMVTAIRDAGSGSLWDLHGRLSIWRDAVSVFSQHWLTGTGAGSFGLAIQSNRTDRRFETWSHAHNDWIEWATDTGLIGLSVGVVLALLWAPVVWRAAKEVRSRSLLVSLGGLGLVAALDFPFRVPVLYLGFAFLLGVLAGQSRRWRAPLWMVRAAVGLLIGAQIAGGAWVARQAVIRDATRTLQSDAGAGSKEQAVATLQRWAPGGEALGLVGLTPATADARCPQLQERFRLSDRVYRACALAWLDTDPSRAVEAAEWAVRIAPADHRHWVLRARAISLDRPLEGLEAWRDAIAVAPELAIRAGWESIPVGLYWVDAVSDLSPEVQVEVARFVLGKGDAEAAKLGFESSGVQDDPSNGPAYIQTLLASGDLDGAARRLQALPVASDPVASRVARALEKAGRHGEAAAIWASHPSIQGARFRNARALRRAGRAAESKQLLERAQLAGEQITADEAYLLADLYREERRPQDCVETLLRSVHPSKEKERKALNRRIERCGRGLE